MFRKDLKYRIKNDKSLGKYYLQFQSNLTGCWIICSSRFFNTRKEAKSYLNSNKE